MNILCLGVSYTGRYLWRNLCADHQAYFLSRHSGQEAEEGLAAFTASQWRRMAQRVRIDAVVDTVPAIAASHSQEAIEEPPYLDEVKQVVRRNPAARLVHLSSTSVYPSCLEESDLPALDENASAAPDKVRGKRRLLLEKRWLEEFPSAMIIRSAGIYGPDRCLALRFKRGDFGRTEQGNRVVSRIHVHDLCRLVLALAHPPTTGSSPSIVHAVDEASVPIGEVFEFLEALLSIQIPGNWHGSPARGRRIVSLYAKSLLGGTYRYPSYKQGFAACLQG